MSETCGAEMGKSGDFSSRNCTLVKGHDGDHAWPWPDDPEHPDYPRSVFAAEKEEAMSEKRWTLHDDYANPEFADICTLPTAHCEPCFQEKVYGRKTIRVEVAPAAEVEALKEENESLGSSVAIYDEKFRLLRDDYDALKAKLARAEKVVAAISVNHDVILDEWADKYKDLAAEIEALKAKLASAEKDLSSYAIVVNDTEQGPRRKLARVEAIIDIMHECTLAELRALLAAYREGKK